MLDEVASNVCQALFRGAIRHAVGRCSLTLWNPL